MLKFQQEKSIKLHASAKNIPQKIRNLFQLNFQGDLSYLVIVLLLSIWGALMVYSGSVIVAARQGNPASFYFIRQVAWIILGLTGLFVFYKIDYHTIVKFSPLALGITVFWLILVLLLNYNDPIKRWIDLGAFDFQPSELAKLVFLIYLSGWLAKFKHHGKITKDAIKLHLKTQLLPFILVTSVILVLIFIEPDLDTAIILGLASFIIYFIAGNDTIHFLGSFLLGLLLTFFTTVATLMAKYRITRLETFIEFWRSGVVPNPTTSGYQLRQILVAIASGGLFGVGFGESRQKFHYLGDTAFSDTIFAIFAEEFGLIGSIILISLILFLFLKAIKIAKAAPDKLGFLLVISMTTWLTLQAFMHIAANVALIPINGNTLPFFSYGGSSTIVNLCAVGLILNISKYSQKSSYRRYPLRR